MDDFFKKAYLKCLPYILLAKSYSHYFIVIFASVFTTIIFVRLFEKPPIVDEKGFLEQQDRLCSLGLYSYCYNTLSNFNNSSYLDIFEQIAKGSDRRNISPDIVRSALSSIKQVSIPSINNDYLLDYLSKEISSDNLNAFITGYKENIDLIKSVSDKYQISPYLLSAIWVADKLDYEKYNDNIFSILTTMLHKFPFSYETEGKIYASMKILDKYKIPPYYLSANQNAQLGHTKFSPQEYLDYSVDINNDNFPDVWNNKSEAISSVANYLKDNGWPEGESIAVYSVIAPYDFVWDMNFFNFGPCQGSDVNVSEGNSLLEWSQKGMIQDNKEKLPELGDNTFYFIGSRYDRVGNYWRGFLVNKAYFSVMRYACSVKYSLKIMLIAKIIQDVLEKDLEVGSDNIPNLLNTDDVLVEGPKEELSNESN